MKAKYRGERPRRRPSQEERIEAKYKGRTPRISCAPVINVAASFRLLEVLTASTDHIFVF